MKIIGLTGSIAAGKSTIAGWINELGIATHDADKVVHKLLGPGGAAVEDVLIKFGSHLGTTVSGIDRKLLGDEVFTSPQKRKKLESILHPLVRYHRDTFITQRRNANAAAVVLDVPLLFETGGETMCDYVIVVYASFETTVKRALARPGMTKDKLTSILSSQMPINDKKIRADLALNSDLRKDKTRKYLIDWLSDIGLTVVRVDAG